MKQKLFALAFLFSVSSLGKAQTPAGTSAVVKPKTIVLKLDPEETRAYGFLVGMNDTTIIFSSNRTAFSDTVNENSSFHSYRYYEIEKVGIRKYGSLRNGIIIGGLAGAALGSLLQSVAAKSLTFGSFDGSPLTSSGGSDHTFTGLITGAITGTIIGVLAGTNMRKFNIGRNKQKFMDMKADILQRYLMPSPKDSSIIY